MKRVRQRYEVRSEWAGNVHTEVIVDVCESYEEAKALKDSWEPNEEFISAQIVPLPRRTRKRP